MSLRAIYLGVALSCCTAAAFAAGQWPEKGARSSLVSPATTRSEPASQGPVMPVHALAGKAVEDDRSASATAESIPAWEILPGGELGFAVSSESETIRGKFSRWTGSIRLDPDKPTQSSIRIAVDLSSAAMIDSSMSEMLRGPDFFAIDSFPQATWTSSDVRLVSPGHYVADGTLSLKGVSRPQSLTFELVGGANRQHAAGRAEVNRSLFRVGQGAADDALESAVTIEFSFDAVRTVG